MKDLFLLDPEIVFLNHGSFGAAPKKVIETYQAWQLLLERQPVQFIVRDMLGELENARRALGKYINASKDDLVFVPNATFGVNIVARSLNLQTGDQILASDHEYGACANIWSFIAQKTGAEFINQPIPLPLGSSKKVADTFWDGVTPRTKVIFLSHISSPTAQRMPVEIICRRARAAGILTIIDGAHAPGQIPLSLREIDPDFYVGNCHKWMLSPKGAGFLYARNDLQDMVEPLVVSWGWGQNAPYTSESRYVHMLEWLGTNDPSAYLSVPAAIQFMEERDWTNIRKQCRQKLKYALEEISKITGLNLAYSTDSQPFAQMAIAPLPTIKDIKDLQTQLIEQYNIEIPCIEWNGGHYIRISVQAYNTESDIETLLYALVELIPKFAQKR